MKKIIKILLALLILLIIFAGIATLMHQGNQHKVENLNQYANVIGSNSNGTVYKITGGNSLSSDTAIVILGVHSLESGIHNATYESILILPKIIALIKSLLYTSFN